MAHRITSLVILFALSLNLALALDRTREDKASGFEVVDATCELIHNSKIFADDFSFLYRLAFVETHFGTDDGTFTNPDYKGIWRLNEGSYNKTKDPSLNALHSKINAEFNINWINTNWDRLNTPLHGGLAARLFIETLPAIPQTKAKQADYWYQYYTQLEQTADYFKTETDKLEEDTPPCEGKMDLVVVLDGSGSVGSAEFEKAKGFVANLLNTFSNNTEFVRKGFIIFSSIPETIFTLTSNLNAAQMNERVLNARYPAGGTYTNDAIKAAVDLVKIAPSRPGIPRVMTVFTDGQSSGGVSNIELARQAGITPFAIGIGNLGNLNMAELLQIALGESSKVYTVEDFNALAEFFRRLNDDTCKIPQTPSIGEDIADTLGKKQKRYYQFVVPAGEGLGIEFTTLRGTVNAFYSYSFPTPNSALHDGIIEAGTSIPPMRLAAPRGRVIILDETYVVYVSVEGVEDQNEYEIRVEEGGPIPDFTRSVQLSPEINVTWVVYKELEKVQFQVNTLTPGFISFGLSDDGAEADFIIGGLNSDQTPYFTDRYAADENSSTIDAKQDWRLIEVQENGNATTLWFIRSFDTGDNLEDLLITSRVTHFIWALGSSDSLNSSVLANGFFPVNILELENFERTEQISPLINLIWSVNFDTKKVIFDLTARTTAYVGFGISKEGGMNNADLIVGGVGDDLMPYFDDWHSGSAGDPIIDDEQNWLVILVREERGTTHLKFIRDFDTKDSMDLPIKLEDTHFIWAIGESDKIDFNEGTRGNFPVNIFQDVSKYYY